jgi:hypothetical protein
MMEATQMIAGRLNNTKSKFKITLDDASLKQKKELFYFYVMKLKYHMGEMLKMPKENKIKFITSYLYLKFIVEVGPNVLAIDETDVINVLYVDHIRNWPKEITGIEWSLAQTNKLLKNLQSIEYSADEMESIETSYITEF